MSVVNAPSSARPFGVALGRTVLAENLAGITLRDGELRHVRHRLAQPVILFLKLLEALHLVTLQATKLLPPAAIRKLRHGD
jgi:hypothetical protein